MTESAHATLHARRRTAAYQRTARWLLCGVIGLILYGSLFPFQFDTGVLHPLLELAASLAFERASRGDIVANLLLYIPLGLCMAVALPGKWRALTKLALTVVAGIVLSLGVELVQTMEPARVSSLTDVVLNAAGTAIGAAVALTYVAVGTHLRIPGLVESRPAPVPLGFVLLWLSFRLAPFVPTLDWQKIKDSLKPVLLNPTLDAFEALRFLIGWLVIAHAVRRIWRPQYALIVLVALAAGTQLGRILIVGKTVNPAEVVALVAMFLLLPLMRRLTTARRLLVLSFALAAIVVVQGLEPWQFDASAHSFSWVPFKNSLSDSLEVNVSVLLEKCFWYASLVWLLAQRSGALVVSGVVVTLLVGALEFVQIWLPGRSAEITDPLIVIAAAGLIGLFSDDGRTR